MRCKGNQRLTLNYGGSGKSSRGPLGRGRCRICLKTGRAVKCSAMATFRSILVLFTVLTMAANPRVAAFIAWMMAEVQPAEEG